ncbi:UPF0764 protein C16orf89 homolog [Pseudophryne corroboree]|uniref:UPF0764 protein C16orf89 homolog n=1 Tax=Pseudophryne corroboree TaxID=495146 RepID=UPI0030813556
MKIALLLVLLAVCNCSETHNEMALRNVISAIWKAVLLLKNEDKEFNLDGMAGFRLLLEQIKGTLKRFEVKKDLYDCILLKRMEKVLNNSLNNALYYTKQRDPQYFDEFLGLFGDQFWILPSAWNHTIPELVYKEKLPDKSLCLIEEFSDQCMSALLGSPNGDKEACIVSSPCWKKMKQIGCSDYSLSHQLLYFIIGKMKRCRNDLFIKEGNNYMNIYCANMMKINHEIEQNGYPFHQQDIFMENIMLCGLCGYSDFYKLEWMNKIISWQDPVSGCFGYIGENGITMKSDKINYFPKRVKRRERMFLDICLSHKTAMAVGALGGFLYYFTM